MKLAACYTVYNGLELLEASIKQIESEVDFIIIGYQTISNKGIQSDEVRPFLDRFQFNKKVFLMLFEPNLSVNTKENELMKHNMLAGYAQILGCTHFFISATDHFYNIYEFRRAKFVCEKHDFDLTFTKMYTYYKHVTWQLTPIEDYCMPFIIKLHPGLQFKYMQNYPVHVDPSIMINQIGKWFCFDESEIMMHHYSMIRKDIRNKFNNAAASIRWPAGQAEKFAHEFDNYDINANAGISYFGGRKIKVVEDYFALAPIMMQ